jgi:hypothetical protein
MSAAIGPLVPLAGGPFAVERRGLNLLDKLPQAPNLEAIPDDHHA